MELIIKQPDGTLIVTSRTKDDHSAKVKEFVVETISDSSYLTRLLIGAYIGGFSSIKLTAKKRIPNKVRPIVRAFTQMTIGQEVVEETPTMIIIKDLLNPTEMPMDRTIQRMYIIVKGMHEDAIKALVSGTTSLAEDVRLRDNEVDRLHWLVSRQYNLILKNAALTEKLGTTIEEANIYYLNSRIMERMGDHAVRISKHIPTLLEKKVNPRIRDKIQKASAMGLALFNHSIDSLLKGDLKGSNDNIENIEKLEVLCREINTLALKHKGAVAISVGYIVESLRRLGDYAKNISENAINHMVCS